MFGTSCQTDVTSIPLATLGRIESNDDIDKHKKDSMPAEQAEAMNEIKEQLQAYVKTKTETETETKSEARARMALLSKQLGLNIKDLTDEELKALMKKVQE